MIAPLDDVTARALSLSLEERAQLIQRLLPTIEDSQEQVEAAWSAEIARRVAEVEAGTAALIPADQVMAEARARVKAVATARR